MIKIKNNVEIEKMRIAGRINASCHSFIKEFIKAGITTKEINDKCDEFIRSHGGIPSFLGYDGFPGSVCISINDEVVHGIPGSRKVKSGDIVSIDIGVIYEGFHSDAAYTYKVGKIDKNIENLLKYTEQSLYAGIEIIKEGVKLSEVSIAIEKVANKHNLGIVRELVGHGVGKKLHEEPDIPNYFDRERGIILKAGMTLAIEPMFTLGNHKIGILEDDWTIVTLDGSPAAHFEHTVLVTKKGYTILTGEKNYG